MENTLGYMVKIILKGRGIFKNNKCSMEFYERPDFTFCI